MPAVKNDAFFMPFTPQRAFRKKPRLIAAADGMFYTADDGRILLDGMAGMWCSNAGHNHPLIMAAIRKQTQTYDYTPGFLFSNPLAIATAQRLCALMPGDLGHVFFSNSGSEAVDTALKIAIAYQRARGRDKKVRIIGRERGYHGVNIGGTSVGGIPGNRGVFAFHLMPHVMHLPHTHNLDKQAFSKGRPAWGGHLADALDDIAKEYGGETVCAVIVEPVAGSTGVLPPPEGYLEKLRAICDKHDILLIFDEVITGFGRLGRATAAERFGVVPDILCASKGITGGAAPMGATFLSGKIFDAFMHGPEYGVEFAHGYTASAHPIACAAAMGALDAYEQGRLFAQAIRLETVFTEALHDLKSAPHVVDIRSMGLMGGIELAPGGRDYPAKEPSRAMEVFERMYWEENLVGRFTGNTLALCPALVATEDHITRMVDKVRRALVKVK